ncbi:MAG: Ig-like domain repeat protein, partial [Bryocella sp.]
ITVASPAAIVFGVSNVSLSASVAYQGPTVPSGAFTFHIDSGAVVTATCAGTATPLTCTASYPAATITAGSHTVTGTVAPGGIYLTASSTSSLTVNQAGTTTALTSSASTINPSQSITLTANVASLTSGTPTGSVTFYDSGTSIGTASLVNGIATFVPPANPASTNSYTATYTGSANYLTSTSTGAGVVVVVTPLEFTFPTMSSTGYSVTPGKIATYTFELSPLYGAFPAAVTFSVTGLPPGATATFTPSTVLANAGPTTVVLTVHTAGPVAQNHAPKGPNPLERTTAFFALLLLPAIGGLKFRKRLGTRFLTLLVLIGGLAAVAGMTGCGSRNGLLLQQPVTYNLTVTAQSGSISHSQNLTLTVQ